MLDPGELILSDTVGAAAGRRMRERRRRRRPKGGSHALFFLRDLACFPLKASQLLPPDFDESIDPRDIFVGGLLDPAHALLKAESFAIDPIQRGLQRRVRQLRRPACLGVKGGGPRLTAPQLLLGAGGEVGAGGQHTGVRGGGPAAARAPRGAGNCGPASARGAPGRRNAARRGGGRTLARRQAARSASSLRRRTANCSAELAASSLAFLIMPARDAHCFP